MATYTRTITRGRIINTLKYRGHTFTESWEVGKETRCEFSIETQVQQLFEDLPDEEFEIVEKLEDMEQFDLEDAIRELDEYETKYRYAKSQEE